MPLAYQSGPGSAALSEPFESSPYDRVTVLGVRYDLRAVVSHMRMLIGLDLPYTTFDVQASRRTYTVNGQPRQVAVQSVDPYELRFGLGGEYAFGPAVPFVDVVGAIHWVSTKLVVDQDSVKYGATGFGFAVRAGARMQLRSWFFVTVSGEIGLVGPELWSADVSAGFRVP